MVPPSLYPLPVLGMDIPLEFDEKIANSTYLSLAYVQLAPKVLSSMITGILGLLKLEVAASVMK